MVLHLISSYSYVKMRQINSANSLLLLICGFKIFLFQLRIDYTHSDSYCTIQCVIFLYQETTDLIYGIDVPKRRGRCKWMQVLMLANCWKFIKCDWKTHRPIEKERLTLQFLLKSYAATFIYWRDQFTFLFFFFFLQYIQENALSKSTSNFHKSTYFSN